jgi:glycosyltransferase involved in cell wall biosynthesis
MKVLMVIPAVGTVYGGPTKIVLELAQAVGNLGHDVDIVTTPANGSTNLDVPLYQWVDEKNYRIQYFPYWDIADYKISLALTKWLFQHVTNYDLVHTNAVFSYPVLPAHWACQWHKVPYIMTPHGMLEPWAMAYKAEKKRLYYDLLEKPALQKAAAIQITGSPEASSIKSYGIKTPMIFVANGIHRHDCETLADPEVFYREFPHTRNKTLIIFLARIDPKKGLDLLAKAFSQVYAQFPQAHLIVAGQDNTGFLPTVQNYFTESGCLEAITFTGMLTGVIKYAALGAATIYVAPSYSEGFSMSVLEGMAAGLPCVITTACNFPEAGEAEAAYIVKVDAEEIAQKLIYCLQHPQLAKQTGDRARQLIMEQYTWERIALKLQAAYKAIVN